MTFCDAFLQMPVPPIWSTLFFIMLILLGIDSEFGTLEGLVAPFYDMKWVTMRKEFFTGKFIRPFVPNRGGRFFSSIFANWERGPSLSRVKFWILMIK